MGKHRSLDDVPKSRARSVGRVGVVVAIGVPVVSTMHLRPFKDRALPGHRAHDPKGEGDWCDRLKRPMRKIPMKAHRNADAGYREANQHHRDVERPWRRDAKHCRCTQHDDWEYHNEESERSLRQ